MQSIMDWKFIKLYFVFCIECDVQWIKLVSDYHTKYIQILGGTSFVKELVPVKKVVTEATKYCVEYE